MAHVAGPVLANEIDANWRPAAPDPGRTSTRMSCARQVGGPAGVVLADGVGVSDSSTPVSTSVDGALDDDGAEVAGGADGVGCDCVFDEVQAAAKASGSATISQADRRIS
jgi:hypothetical protein